MAERLKNPRVRLQHYAAALAREIRLPQSRREWLDLALNALEFVPGLAVPATVLGLCAQLSRRDYKGFALKLAGLAFVPRTVGLLSKIVRGVERFWQSVRFAASVTRRARTLAAISV